MANGPYEAYGQKVISLQEYVAKGNSPQYYAHIWKSLSEEGTSWTDETFPPEIVTIVGDAALENAKHKAGPGFTYEFKRPKDIVDKPVFMIDNVASGKAADRFDILQGGVGDCWFMAALNAVVEKKPLFKMVAPKNNEFDGRGIFHFRFWKCGIWVEVVVDDWLLCKTSEAGETTLAFAKNRGNEFWVPLLEKAYAKLNGSYSEIHFGYPFDALVDLTGGIFNVLGITKDTYGSIVEALERGSIVCLGKSGIPGKPAEYVMENGLVTSHCYSVTGIKKVPFKGKEVTLLSIRNSYADNEWNGAWSDGHVNWNEFDADTVSRLGLDKNNGEFWMQYEDVAENFSEVYLCLLPNSIAKQLALEGVEPKYWESHASMGAWRESTSMEIDDIAANQQYILHLKPGRKSPVQVVIGVYNKEIRLTNSDPVHEENKIYIYKLQDPSDYESAVPFAAVTLKQQEKVRQLNTTEENTFLRESVDYLTFKNGVYLLIPVYGKTRGFSGEYCIRVFTDTESELRKLINEPCAK